MRQLEIRLLGRFEVLVDSRAVPADAWPQRRAADLVKVLALAPGHRMPRDAVLDALWPRLGADAAAANLHKAASYARRAIGDLLVFLNPDAFLQDGCVAELVREIEGKPVPCIVGGRVLNADRTEQRGARRGEITLMSALMSLSGLARRAGLRRYEVHWEAEALPERAAPTPTISGACFCMRREDFEAVTGFDEGYFLHVEDVDLCWRVRRQGGSVLFHPKAEVIHLGHTSQTSPLRVELYKGLGLARYFRKRAKGLGEAALAWALSPLIVCTAVARPVLWRLTGRAA